MGSLPGFELALLLPPLLLVWARRRYRRDRLQVAHPTVSSATAGGKANAALS